MINIEIEKSVSSLRLRVSGHAGYACKGRDIVCAGVSSLCQAFLSSVKAFAERGDFGGFSFEISDGFLSLNAVNYKNERTHYSMEAYISMLYEGLRAIADAYKDYVRLYFCSEAPEGELTDIDTSEKTMTGKAGERNGI